MVAKRGEISHRDRINTDSDISRGRFVKKLAVKFAPTDMTATTGLPPVLFSL